MNKKAVLLSCLAVTAAAAGEPKTPFPGEIKIHIDMTDLDRGIVQVRESLPAQSGPMTLAFPRYLDGYPSPPGALAGFVFTAGGQPLAWRRDAFDVYAFHLDVPPGSPEVVATFDYVAPLRAAEGRAEITPDLLELRWPSLAMYPLGWDVRTIPTSASVSIPAGWTAGTALVQKSATSAGALVFETLPFEQLLDRPLLAGRYARTTDLGFGVHMDAFGDSPAAIAVTDEQIARYRAMVTQTAKLMGGRHYRDYHLLLIASDKLGGIGLGGGASSESGSGSDFFTNWGAHAGERAITVHEYLHSWNGYYRVPAEWVRPDYESPLDPAFNWMIEGLTTWWAYELQTRAGLATPDMTRAMLASDVARNDARASRRWQPLADNVHAGALGRGVRWGDWQTYPDYYEEGTLLWLDVDMLIRELSHDRRSLDDFSRAFFGRDDGSTTALPYTMSDVVAALNAVQPYDWEAYFHRHIDELAPHPPMDWLARGGYRLVFTGEPNEVEAQRADTKASDFSYSLGLVVASAGQVTSVKYDGPAFQAKLMPGDELQHVNDAPFSGVALADAIKKAAASHVPVALTFKRGDRVLNAHIAYFGGLRYPHLEKLSNGGARLDAAFLPL